jgi:hypothetical protein
LAEKNRAIRNKKIISRIREKWNEKNINRWIKWYGW